MAHVTSPFIKSLWSCAANDESLRFYFVIKFLCNIFWVIYVNVKEKENREIG